MWTFSIFSAVFIFIGFLLLGMLAQYLWTEYKRKNKTDWKSKYKTIESEHNDLSKKVKKEQRGLIQARNDRDESKTQLESVEKQIPVLKEEYRTKVTEMQAEIDAAKQESRDIRIQKTHVDKDMEKWKREFEKLKEKYATDVGDVKAFRNEREGLESEIVKFKNKYAKYYKETSELKTELESHTEQMKTLRETKRDLRKTTAQKNKLEKDVEYWEKKHYDTHHELAVLVKSNEGLTTERDELTQMRSGDAVVIGNMKKQIELFKTKFLDVDQKYKQLTKS